MGFWIDTEWVQQHFEKTPYINRLTEVHDLNIVQKFAVSIFHRQQQPLLIKSNMKTNDSLV